MSQTLRKRLARYDARPAALRALMHRLRPRSRFWLALFLLPPFMALGLGVPLAWMNFRLRSVAEPLAYRAFDDLRRVEAALMARPGLHDLRTGQEAELKALLAEDPLLQLFCEKEGRCWIREGDGLRRMPEPPAGALPPAHAEFASAWMPGPAWGPEGFPSVWVRNAEGWALRVWHIGGADTEHFLARHLDAVPLLQIGVRRRRPEDRPLTSSSSPSLQAQFTRSKASRVELKAAKSFFGPDWELVGIPSASQRAELEALFYRSLLEAVAILLLALLLTGAAWRLRLASLRRSQEDLDRLAALTHSLKTPLAVLKLRCDSLRLGQLDSVQAEGHFLRIGEEVDVLTQLIDQALRGFQGTAPAPGAASPIHPEDIRRLSREFELAFQAESRPLDLELDAAPARAEPGAFRTALVTLLENALIHGQGPTRLVTRPHRGRWYLEVTNAGGDLHADQVPGLGRAFFRPRRPGSEGHRREGHGLGLFLLGRSAERHGWGFEVEVGPEGLFSARLELPRA